MRHHLVEEWEATLNELLKRVDHTLEEEFGDLLDPHPARPRRGATANPQHDGLFRITASFTPGFGSRLGKGYVLQVDTVALGQLPDDARARVRARAINLVRAGLAQTFPGTDLRLEQDGPVWKILGDLSLKRPRR